MTEVAKSPQVKAQAPHEAIRFGLCSRSNEQKTAPVLDFVEDIPEFLAKQGLSERPDDVVEELNRLHRGLKLHQQKIYSERAELQRRLPELKENMKLIKAIRGNDKTNLRFMAADSVWVDGVIEPDKSDEEPKVALWLGAGVMMEYTYDEAEKLLTANIDKSEAVVTARTSELLFLKEQLTMCEVTMSRFYNYGVQQKKLQRKREEEAMASKGQS